MKNHKTHEGICKYCQQPIWWRESRSGRRYPADPEQIKPHSCAKTHYTRVKRDTRNTHAPDAPAQ
jgi:hypothetical protein